MSSRPSLVECATTTTQKEVDGAVPEISLSCKRRYSQFDKYTREEIAAHMRTLKQFAQQHVLTRPTIPANFSTLLANYSSLPTAFYEHAGAVGCSKAELYEDCMAFLLALDPENLEMSFVLRAPLSNARCASPLSAHRLQTDVRELWHDFLTLVAGSPTQETIMYTEVDGAAWSAAHAILPWPFAWLDDESGVYRCVIDKPTKQLKVQFRLDSSTCVVGVHCTMCNDSCSFCYSWPHHSIAIWTKGKRELLCDQCAATFRQSEDLFRPLLRIKGEIGLHRVEWSRGTSFQKPHTMLSDEENTLVLNKVPCCSCGTKDCARHMQANWSPYVDRAFD